MAGIFDAFEETRRVSFQDSEGTVITFDATVSEDHVISQEATKHPVEDGSVVNDHTVKPPNVLTLNVIKSSHPTSLENSIKNLVAGVPGSILSQSGNQVGSILGAVSTAVGTSLVNDFTVTDEEGREFTPVQVAFNTLEALRDDATLISVTTELKTYTNMIVANVKIPRTAQNRYSLVASITLEEIQIVSPESVTISSRDITPNGNVLGGGALKPDGSPIEDKEKLTGAQAVQKQGTKQAKTNSILKNVKDNGLKAVTGLFRG